jgi:hypothetical protein
MYVPMQIATDPTRMPPHFANSGGRDRLIHVREQ